MSAKPPSQRFDAVDVLRGAAIVWMTLFHFCFDLNHFGYLQQNFYVDPFWTWQRTGIVSLFLFCAGFSQAIAVRRRQSWRGFWRRWAQVAGCALLVTAGSILMFPQSYIYFGVLHGIAVMLIVARLTAGWGGWLWLAGVLAIASKFIAAEALSAPPMAGWAELFNSRALNWLGWITRKPLTEDYVPLLPWLGVVWWGLAAGRWVLERRPRWLAWRSSGAPGRALALLGRWSLSWYMLHQLLLIGALMTVGALLK